MTTISEILETLRQQAELYTADFAGTRRPSWAPALVINEEFAKNLRSLGLLEADDKPIVRLWAKFADPREKGTILRENFGLALPGVRCRGFELHAGATRKGECLFRAKRGVEGGWDHGPNRWQHTPDFALHILQRDVRLLERNCEIFASIIEQSGGAEQQPNVVRDLEQEQRKLDELREKCQPLTAAHNTRNEIRTHLLELARDRVIEFGGGDLLTQMVAGAHVTGRCGICGKTLTDAVSVERGIGPDCYAKHSHAIDAWVAKQRAAAA